ncbi:hypothetical protein SAMN04488115_11185 [Bosea lathyri]|uniref:Uncharacterized protein n=1 Tax=Bosea lathyri TaxID=1036778 RepID=A0A1H6CN81_9HYPH|nr:hypothetical protein SAMN04488115_11185 [Bosea lathyri]
MNRNQSAPRRESFASQRYETEFSLGKFLLGQFLLGKFSLGKFSLDMKTTKRPG